MVLRRVEHHFDDALDVTIGGNESGHVDAKPARDRRADLTFVELFALDLARFDDVLRQRTEHRFIAKRETERLHPPDQTALPVTNGRKRRGESIVPPAEVRPFGALMNIGHNLRALCGDYDL